ncbi:hypothetical protein QBC32DRAFT_341189 [Pseudoneurospora amorphoporcata]|uniref:Uncharacterized protein n=1 Tax=Pseudoneurospora amorphoporcata TaxID=241081 RepID=A0AAN6NWW6_9PEZI|nr:hypothetical protein QBC32DRAFT_341189 [Pseudoneurospora amorphoporcata]
MESSPIPVPVESSVVSIQEPTLVVSSRPDPPTMPLDVPTDGAVPKNRQMLNGFWHHDTNDPTISTRNPPSTLSASAFRPLMTPTIEDLIRIANQSMPQDLLSERQFTFSQIASILVPD